MPFTTIKLKVDYMRLLVLWLDSLDSRYCTPENMPFLNSLGEFHRITTPLTHHAISAKAIYFILFGELNNQMDFPILKNKCEDLTQVITWNMFSPTKAFVFFPYMSTRNTDNTYYTKESEFFGGLSGDYDWKYYSGLADERNKKNNEFFRSFLENENKKNAYELVIVRDDALDAYSHVLIGDRLSAKYKEKDLYLKSIAHLFDRVIVFSDHGANHDPAYPVFMSNIDGLTPPEAFEGIPDKIKDGFTLINERNQKG